MGTFTRLPQLVITLGSLSSLVLVGGCALDAAPEQQQETTSQVAERLWDGWTDGTGGNEIVGMAIAPSTDKGFAWLVTGQYCRGTARNPCSDGFFPYSVPGTGYTAIRAVGIAKNTSHVYAWYSDSTVSQGTSSNFQAYAGKLSFSRPAKPSGGTFAMDDLIEADCSSNLEWYYYWVDGSQLYRTIGTSRDASFYSAAQTVHLVDPATSIVGIAFDNNTTAKIWTYYSDGSLNISTNSLDLAQP